MVIRDQDKRLAQAETLASKNQHEIENGLTKIKQLEDKNLVLERRLIELSRVKEELTRKYSESDQKIEAYEKSVKNL